MNTRTDLYELDTGPMDPVQLHHPLLGLVDAIIGAEGTDDRASRRDWLNGVLAAASVQFEREEHAMRASGHIGLDPHRLEHEGILEAIRAHIAEVQGDVSEKQGESTAPSITNRLMRHVVAQDMTYLTSLLPEAAPAAGGTTVPNSFDEQLLDLHVPMRWSASYATDIQPIDENHQLIFALIGEIVDRQASATFQDVSELLERLGNETVEHFQHEEKVMADYRYEFAAAHQEEHKKLLEEFACQVDEFRNGSVSAELMGRFLYRWFVRHIQESDIPLSNAVRRRQAGG